jgi:hypothetical protein
MYGGAIRDDAVEVSRQQFAGRYLGASQSSEDSELPSQRLRSRSDFMRRDVGGHRTSYHEYMYVAGGGRPTPPNNAAGGPGLPPGNGPAIRRQYTQQSAALPVNQFYLNHELSCLEDYFTERYGDEWLFPQGIDSELTTLAATPGLLIAKLLQSRVDICRMVLATLGVPTPD